MENNQNGLRLRTPLLSHQVSGVQWMQASERAGRRGGILADDPGLGKTRTLLSHAFFTSTFPLHYITFIRHRQFKLPPPFMTTPNEMPSLPTLPTYPQLTLIIAPLTLCTQWAREYQKMFCATEEGDDIISHLCLVETTPACKAILRALRNLQRNQQQQQQYFDSPIYRHARAIRCIICSPARFLLLPTLCDIFYCRTIIDEADLARTERTAFVKALHQLQHGAIWCATATPINNSWKDIFSLCRLIGDEPYASRAWWSRRRHSAISAQALHQEWLRHYVLRRTMQSIALILPPFTKRQAACFLTEQEQAWIAHIRNHTPLAALEQTWNIHTANLVKVLRIRMAAVHPSVVISSSSSFIEDTTTIVTDGAAKCWICAQQTHRLIRMPCGLHYECGDNAVGDRCVACHMLDFDPTQGGKMERLLCELVDKLGNPSILPYVPLRTSSGRVTRAIVLSQWLRTLELAQQATMRMGFRSVLLHGQLNDEARATCRHMFETDPTIQIMFLAVKMGGMGLDLSIAQHVIWLDEPPNPALSRQGDARCYRIGQPDPTSSTSLILPEVPEEMQILEELHRVKRAQSNYMLGRTLLRSKRSMASNTSSATTANENVFGSHIREEERHLIQEATTSSQPRRSRFVYGTMHSIAPSIRKVRQAAQRKYRQQHEYQRYSLVHR